MCWPLRARGAYLPHTARRGSRGPVRYVSPPFVWCRRLLWSLGSPWPATSGLPRPERRQYLLPPRTDGRRLLISRLPGSAPPPVAPAASPHPPGPSHYRHPAPPALCGRHRASDSSTSAGTGPMSALSVGQRLLSGVFEGLTEFLPSPHRSTSYHRGADSIPVDATAVVGFTP